MTMKAIRQHVTFRPPCVLAALSSLLKQLLHSDARERVRRPISHWLSPGESIVCTKRIVQCICIDDVSDLFPREFFIDPAKVIAFCGDLVGLHENVLL